MPRPRHGRLLPVLSTPAAPRRPRGRDLLLHIRRLIADGVLAPGARLPSTRTLGEEYGLSRSTVEVVFDDLVAAGLIERRHGSGSTVATTLSDLPEPPRVEPEPVVPGRATPATPHRGRTSRTSAATRVTKSMADVVTPGTSYASTLSTRGTALGGFSGCREPAIVRPFNAGIPDAAAFPHEAWQRSLARAWRRSRADLLAAFDPLGYPPLRERLRQYLTTFRGVRCTADQILITTSSQSALHLIALLLLDPGDRVWLENPGYRGARAAFHAAGATIVPVPVDRDGLRVDAGLRRAPDARLAFVTPSHQHPTGVMLGLDRCVALLAWAASRDAWIVEDDYDGEFRYSGMPAAALQGLDRHQRVIYLGTFSKVLSPALRLAYAVVPSSLVEPLANLRTQIDGFTATPLQAALAEFFDSGQFESHVRRMRARYAQKRDALVHALAFLERERFELMPTVGGFHGTILERMPGIARRASARADEFGLSLDALNQYAHGPLARDGLVLRYGALSLDAIADGGRRLQRLLRALP